jgi:hypothetical protein
MGAVKYRTYYWKKKEGGGLLHCVVMCTCGGRWHRTQPAAGRMAPIRCIGTFFSTGTQGASSADTVVGLCMSSD